LFEKKIKFIYITLSKEMILEQEILPDEYIGLSAEELNKRILSAKERLGKTLVILGHHYQRDEIVRYADYTGDSLKLARIAASLRDVKYIVFCGVHFMAESADILANEGQIVILPDLEAGCSMADMAMIEQVEECWDCLISSGGDRIVPVTYINSSAEVKAFCGRHNGIVCTSSNAEAVFKWAFNDGRRILFLPDEHLGRNTAHFKLGLPLDSMVVWDPAKMNGGIDKEGLKKAKIVLWKGFCSVHMQFNEEQIYSLKKLYPGIKIIVHPECKFEVVKNSDVVGSTEFIIKQVTESPAGSAWGVGTEIHLVNRLAKNNPDKLIKCLNSYHCLCATMFRISPERLLWALENLADGKVVNMISVAKEIKEYSLIALNRMLSVI